MGKPKLAIAILLLGLYLVTAPGTGEMIKIPVLAKHYFKHVKLEKQEGLISFLIEHYLNEDGTDKDANEDSKLPFKSIELSATNNIIIQIASFEISHPESSKHSFLINYSSLFLPSRFFGSIWRPPRYHSINIS